MSPPKEVPARPGRAAGPILLFLCLTVVGCIRNPPDTTPIPLSFWDHQRLENSLSDRDVLLTPAEGTALTGQFLSLSRTEVSLLDTLGTAHLIALTPGMRMEFRSAGRGFRLGLSRGFWGGFALACLAAGDTAFVQHLKRIHGPAGFAKKVHQRRKSPGVFVNDLVNTRMGASKWLAVCRKYEHVFRYLVTN